MEKSASLDKNKILIEGIKDPAFIVDITGRMVFWNSGLETLLLKSKEEIAAESASYSLTLLNGDSGTLLPDYILTKNTSPHYPDKVQNNQDMRTIFSEERVKNSLGQDLILMAKTSPIFDADGKLVGIIEVLMNKPPQKTPGNSHIDIADEIHDMQTKMIASLGEIIESRSEETGHHVLRVAKYSYVLASKLGLDESFCQMINTAAPLHDIGKIAISDEILKSSRTITESEREEIQKHTIIGHKLLIKSGFSIFQSAAKIARSHHEWWNGAGYPDGLKRDRIPIEARIIGLCDVYDALTHKRTYKEKWTSSEALEYIAQNSGIQFDPALVRCFISHKDLIQDISDTIEISEDLLRI